MVCIYCGNKTKVTNSRGSEKTISIWRRRECRSCKRIFTTREHIDYESTLRIKRSSGRLEPLQRDKLLFSIHRSLTHRKTAQGDATQLTDTVLKQVLALQRHGLLQASELRDAVAQILERFDAAAGVHYAAHHPG